MVSCGVVICDSNGEFIKESSRRLGHCSILEVEI